MDCFVKKNRVTAITNNALNSAMLDIARTRRRAFNPMMPDEFWIVSGNECEEVYTAGSDLNDVSIPDAINGIPLRRLGRGGKLTYTGPGQLVLAFNVSGKTMRALHGADMPPHQLVSDILIKPVMEYLNDTFDLSLEFHEDDPGLYDAAGNKVVSYGFSVPDGYIVLFCTINLAVDLTKYTAIEVCGRANRPMRNVYDQVGIETETIFAQGSNIVDRVWQTLYKPANNVYEYQDNEPVLIR